MPWVEVYRNPKVVGDGVFVSIINQLPSAVAQAMDVPKEPDGRLTAKDIEVKTFDFNKFDICNFDLVIIVRCEDFPARRKNLKKRIGKIINLIEFHHYVKSFIWVRPVEGLFKEF